MSQLASDPLDQTIASLVHGRDASVRLRHCIDAHPSVGGLTLGEFLSSPAEGRHLLLGLRNLGRKTADELAALVAEAASKPRLGPVAGLREPRARLAFRSLVNLLSTVLFPADLLALEMSTRLRNTLKAVQEAQRQGASGNATVPDNLGAVVASWPDYRRRLVKQANFGRTTVAELECIIERIVSRRLELLCAPGMEVAVTVEGITKDRLDETFHQALIDAADSTEADAASDLAAMLHGIDPNLRLPPREHIQETVSKLPEKERDTITRRYGLDGLEPQTLEQIASRVHVTRERVRQVEAKALGQFGIGANRAAFERIL